MPTAGANTNWTLFGTLPTTLVTQVTYDPTDNVLAVSTFGRGFYLANGLSGFVGHTAPTVKLGAGTTTNGSAAFTAGGAAVSIVDPSVTLTAAGASGMLSGAVISLTNPLDGTVLNRVAKTEAVAAGGFFAINTPLNTGVNVS